MEALSLFPSAVGMFNLNRPLTEKETNFIFDLPRMKNSHNTISVEKFILDFPEMSSLKDFFCRSINEYLTTVVCPKNIIQLPITQSWANYSAPSQKHHPHNHRNSYISGVFYVQTNLTDSITFIKNVNHILHIPVKDGCFNEYNSESWKLPTPTGRLIIFPSHIDHEVPPVEGDVERVSIAFNTFPRGILGSVTRLSEAFTL